MVLGLLAIGGAFVYSYQQAKKAKKAAKKLKDENSGVLINSESNIEAIPVIYGERRIAGTRVYLSTSGDKKHKYLYVAVALCEGEIESISNIEIDDKPFTDDTNVLTLGAGTWDNAIISTSVFNDPNQVVQYEAYEGSDSQSTISLIANQMTTNTLKFSGEYHKVALVSDATNFKMEGIACLALRFEWRDSKNPFQGGLPKITALVKGRKVYDPRLDSTNGGSGSHRSNTPATWAYSNNVALCLRDYLTNSRYGKGLTDAEINDAAIRTAATDLDGFDVTPYSGGTTQKIFECNAVVDTGKKLFENVEDFMMNCRGFLPYYNGQYYLKIDQAVASSDIFQITESMMIGGIEIIGIPKSDKYNQVIVKFPDKELGYEPNQVAWPDQGSSNLTGVNKTTGSPDGVTPDPATHYTESELYDLWVGEDGGEALIDEVDLDFFTNIYSARDMARIFCWRSRKALRCKLTLTSEAIQLACGDVVFVNHQTPDWTYNVTTAGEADGHFQVEEITLNYDGTVDVQLVEFRNSLYPYDESVESIYGNVPYLGDRYPIFTNPKIFVAEGQMQAALGWVFANTDHSWVSTNITPVNNANYITLTSTAADAQFSSPTIAISGALAPFVTAKIRRTAGEDWDGKVYYTTAGHGVSESYKSQITSDPTRTDEWVIVNWDMENLTTGGTDWTDNTITGLRIDLGNSATDEFDIEWVALNHTGQSVTQITNSNIPFFVADLAVDTLQIADQAVTFPVWAESVSATSVSTSWVDVVTLTDTFTGAPVEIGVSFTADRTGGDGTLRFRLVDSVAGTVYEGETEVSPSASESVAAMFLFEPTAASHTIELECDSDSTHSIRAGAFIRALELKK